MDDQLIRVLLIEDDEDDFVIVRDLLSDVENMRFHLEWTPDYSSALESARESHHDVYLMDYRLGVRNGLELLHELKSLGCKAPIIMLTGYGDRGVDIQAMKAGAADYLVKGRMDASLLERSIRYAIDHARTLEALRDSQGQLRRLSAKVLDAQENERKLVARELHDDICGRLVGIKYILEKTLAGGDINEEASSGRLKEVVSMIQQAIEETRRISSNLRPAILDDLGILEAVHWFLVEFERIYGEEVRVEEAISMEEDEVPEHLKIVIYRVLQEAMNNVAKYSGAKDVRISLCKTPDTIELCVEDNGRGLDLDELEIGELSSAGMGIAGMQERTELSGGSLTIWSVKGKGTIVRAIWSLSEEVRTSC